MGGGSDLDLPTRILVVADVFDALSSDRPYRPGMPVERVLGILDEESGEKLCPACVAALRAALDRQAPPPTRKRPGTVEPRASFFHTVLG